MLGILFPPRKESSAIIVDIGNASAGVGLIRMRRGAPSSFSFACRSLTMPDVRAKGQRVVAVSVSIEKALAAYTAYTASRNIPPPAVLYVFLKAPWSRSQAAVVTETFPRAQRVTKNHITSLASRALGDDTGIKAPYEALAVRTWINGYPTGRPIGKTGRSITIAALKSSAEPAMRDKVTSAILSAFPGRTILWHSHVRALLVYMREQEAHTKDCIIIDIGTEVANIILVRGGILEDDAILDEGMQTMLRRISEHTLPEETLALMRMVERDQCSEEACERIRESLAAYEQDLARTFGEHFAARASGMRLPNNLLLVAHPDIVPWLSRFFSRIDFAQFTLTAQPFSVSVLSPEKLLPWVVGEAGVPVDISLLVSAMSVHSESEAKLKYYAQAVSSKE